MNKILVLFFAMNLNFMTMSAWAEAPVKDVTGGDKKEHDTIHQLSSQVLSEVNGSDEASLKRALANAQKDPQKFLKTLNPELQKQIRDLSDRIQERAQESP